MNDVMLVYFRMVSYMAVILVALVSEIRQKRYNYVCRGNMFLAISMLATLIITRFLSFEHRIEIASGLTTMGFMVWAIYHFAEFITNGKEK